MSIILPADGDFLECVTSVILVLTLVVTYYQAYLVRQANYATAYKVARDILQDRNYSA